MGPIWCDAPEDSKGCQNPDECLDSPDHAETIVIPTAGYAHRYRIAVRMFAANVEGTAPLDTAVNIWIKGQKCAPINDFRLRKPRELARLADIRMIAGDDCETVVDRLYYDNVVADGTMDPLAGNPSSFWCENPTDQDCLAHECPSAP
jgi:hypothetical protein